MRLDKPRVEPLALEELDPETRAMFGDGPVINIFRTMAHHPKLMKRWLVFGNHVLAKTSLSPRDRELVILRVGHLCRSGYEWAQHVVIGRASGLSDEEIDRIRRGPEADGWSEDDRVLLRAADELHADSFIGDETWNALAARFDTQQIIDLIFTIGQYHLVSMALNSLGVQLDPGLPTVPER